MADTVRGSQVPPCDMSHNPVRITADAYTNLFIGIFSGTILFALLQIESTSNSFAQIRSLAFFSRVLVNLVYLCLGYYTLFHTYHRDSPLSMAINTAVLPRRIILNSLTYTILFLFAISPILLRHQPYVFYTFLSFLCLMDLIWMYVAQSLIAGGKSLFLSSLYFDVPAMILSILFIVVYIFRPTIEMDRGIVLAATHAMYFVPLILIMFVSVDESLGSTTIFKGD